MGEYTRANISFVQTLMANENRVTKETVSLAAKY